MPRAQSLAYEGFFRTAKINLALLPQKCSNYIEPHEIARTYPDLTSPQKRHLWENVYKQSEFNPGGTPPHNFVLEDWVVPSFVKSSPGWSCTACKPLFLQAAINTVSHEASRKHDGRHHKSKFMSRPLRHCHCCFPRPAPDKPSNPEEKYSWLKCSAVWEMATR